MRQVSTVMLERGTVRHLAGTKESPLRFGARMVTYCGLDARQHTVVVVDDDRNAFGYDLCRTCQKVRDIFDIDIVTPERA